MGALAISGRWFSVLRGTSSHSWALGPSPPLLVHVQVFFLGRAHSLCGHVRTPRTSRLRVRARRGVSFLCSMLRLQVLEGIHPRPQ
ncbi:hypothetical protein DENSPDRAFT_63293 [Dentipellis sp. KUC8613]|nr:hypothetical protein DENSPDRAFT_63293 [Dentipellis sp. KUC8613]